MTSSLDESPTATPSAAICPTCGGVGIPLIYGRPTSAALKAVDAGLLRLGGCLIPVARHGNWAGRDCSHTWYDPSAERRQVVENVLRNLA